MGLLVRMVCHWRPLEVKRPALNVNIQPPSPRRYTLQNHTTYQGVSLSRPSNTVPPTLPTPMGLEDTWNLDEPNSPSWIDRRPSDSRINGSKGHSAHRTTCASSVPNVDEDTPHLMPVDSYGTATIPGFEGGTSIAHLQRSCKEH